MEEKRHESNTSLVCGFKKEESYKHGSGPLMNEPTTFVHIALFCYSGKKILSGIHKYLGVWHFKMS